MSAHPSDRLLTGYATGDLPAPAGLVVAAHAERCLACSRRIAEIEETEGRLLASLPDAPLSPDALQRALRAVGREGAVPDPPPPRGALAGIVLPAVLQDKRLGPRRYAARGVWVAHVRLPRSQDWRAFILRVKSGGRLPRHAHSGEELVAILHGAYSDGEVHRAGEFVEIHADVVHDLEVVGEGACAALIATQGPIRWQGWAKVLGALLDV